MVLTAYHVIEKFVEFKRFIQGSLQFKLIGKNNSIKIFDVIKIRYNVQFDWAILYCQDIIHSNPIFKLITHNSNLERSSLVDRSYICEIVGFKDN